MLLSLKTQEFPQIICQWEWETQSKKQCKYILYIFYLYIKHFVMLKTEQQIVGSDS